MAIHTHTVSAYVETELPEGMTLGAYRVRNLNRKPARRVDMLRKRAARRSEVRRHA